MSLLRDERGGILAKILGLLVVLALIGAAALFYYGKQQRPLSLEGVHIATSDGEKQPASVTIVPGMQIYVATIVHNDGRLPVTLQGLGGDSSDKEQPIVPVSVALGDGKTPVPGAAGFSPPALDPREGIGIVVVFAVNPSLACSRFTDTVSATTAFPLIPLRFSSYGIEATQSLSLGKDAPSIKGLTRAECEAALA
jgi:hypothetical protein